MTAAEKQLLAAEVLNIDASVRLLWSLTVNLVERAADLGCFPKHGNLLRHDVEQLQAVLEGEKQHLEALRIQFDLAPSGDHPTVSPDDASHRLTVTTLIAHRDALTATLRTCQRQLADQRRMVEGAELLSGTSDRNPGARREMMENRIACLLALGIIPKIEARIVELEAELQRVIAAIAASGIHH